MKEGFRIFRREAETSSADAVGRVRDIGKQMFLKIPTIVWKFLIYFIFIKLKIKH